MNSENENEIFSNALALFGAQEVSKVNGYDELHHKLTLAIHDLLSHNRKKLFNIFYRIDVSEKKIQHCFAIYNENEIASELSKLVIERMILKFKYRTGEKK